MIFSPPVLDTEIWLPSIPLESRSRESHLAEVSDARAAEITLNPLVSVESRDCLLDVLGVSGHTNGMNSDQIARFGDMNQTEAALRQLELEALCCQINRMGQQAEGLEIPRSIKKRELDEVKVLNFLIFR
jgi:hypothetical protein